MVFHHTEYHRKTCTKFFFCLLFGTLIHIVLLLTIFQGILHVRHPKARISHIELQDHHVNFSSSPFEKMKLVTQVTLHNPTLGNFWFQNGTLAFFYKGIEISSGFIAGERVKGRSNKMLRIFNLLNTTRVPKQDLRILRDDIDSGVLSLTAYVKLDGEIQLMKVIKRKAMVATPCDLLVNLVVEDIQSFNCK